MGNIHTFGREKLMIGILSSETLEKEEIKSVLEEHFGPADYQSPLFDFTFTDYYNKEMGEGIKRSFFAFEKLVQPESLPEIKILTNKLEEKWRTEQGRMVNLDPGLLCLKRLILASTKDNLHRVPLREGIYAEITLLYHTGAFHTLPWTYPDFRSEKVRAYMEEIRGIYKAQRKALLKETY